VTSLWPAMPHYNSWGTSSFSIFPVFSQNSKSTNKYAGILYIHTHSSFSSLCLLPFPR
jgi:hypothetical protein